MYFSHIVTALEHKTLIKRGRNESSFVYHITWQTYVYVEFATKFEDAAHGVDEVWRDAYNGLCLANGILCMLGGLFCFVTIPNRSASTYDILSS